jgi:hypothetical protein
MIQIYVVTETADYGDRTNTKVIESFSEESDAMAYVRKRRITHKKFIESDHYALPMSYDYTEVELVDKGKITG